MDLLADHDWIRAVLGCVTIHNTHLNISKFPQKHFIIGFGLWGNVPQAAGLGSTGLSRLPVNTAGHQAESQHKF